MTFVSHTYLEYVFLCFTFRNSMKYTNICCIQWVLASCSHFDLPSFFLFVLFFQVLIVDLCADKFVVQVSVQVLVS